MNISTAAAKNIALFLIITVIFVTSIYNNNPLSSFNIKTNIRYQMAQAIPNLQANNSKNISTSASNGTSSNVISTVNHPPVANAGINQTVNENTTVTLNGIASDPDPNDILTYSWTQIAGPEVTLNNNDTTNPSFTTPSISSDTTLKFSLTAKDDEGAASAPAFITIAVKPVDQSPIANAGTDQIVDAGNVVSLDGTASKDPDGDKITYSWVQSEGPNVKLSGADTAISTFTVPSNISSDTNLIFTLTVRDDKQATSTDDVSVIVKYIPPPNKAPVASAGPDQTVNSGRTVKLDGSASKDQDGTITSYIWNQIAGPSVTLNGADTATPTFTAPSNNISSAANAVLVFQLTVTDDKNATSISAVKITVKHTNRSPMANAGTNQIVVNAGDVATLDGSASIDPDNDSIKYLWKQVGGPAVTINGADKPIATFTAPKDISSDTDTLFELTVTDDKGATNMTTAKVTIKYIPPPNQAPTANAGPDQTVNAGDTVTLDGTASTDPDGNITSYSWVQTGGTPVILNGADTSTSSFTAPTVSSDTQLKFSLTVKDDKGESSSPAIVTISVKAAVPVSPQPTAPTPAPSNMSTTEGTSPPKEQYSFVRAWGSEGSGEGQFMFPTGITIDSSGNVYVADYGNNRIQKFTADGTFITALGSQGSGNGQFNNPDDIAIDSEGNVYVADQGNNRIQKFTADGEFITKWGSGGSDDGQFDGPTGLAIDSSGNVYVAEFGNNRIQKFTADGTFITAFGSEGSGNGQFSHPEDVAIDSSGNVYVADGYNSRIQKFTADGTFITKWGSEGIRDGQFMFPFGVAVDSTDNVYVADGTNDRIQKFTADGTFITALGSQGTGEGQSSHHEGVAVNSSGNVYIGEGDPDHRIQEFTPST